MPKELKDNVRRTKASDTAGTATWVGLRGCDPFLQHGLLTGTISAPILNALRGQFTSIPATALSRTGTIFDTFNLSPYRLVLLSMAIGSSVKHIFWKLAIAEQEMPATDAGAIAAFNTIFNSVNALLFVNRYTTIGAGSTLEDLNAGNYALAPLAIGSVLFVTGLTLETVSEVQRALFKRKPENKGKVYTGGLFSLARHINYGGYTLWRSGFALAAGGYAWGAFVAAFFSYDFLSRGIPVLDQYCSDRYADMWKDYKEKTPSKFLPGII